MKRALTPVVLLAVAGLAISGLPLASSASHTPAPTSITIAGSLQSELGCPGDWQPDCTATHLVYDSADDVWQATFSVPAGNWEFKAALDDSWDENYGAGAVLNGPNIPLDLAAQTAVKFYYSHGTHWVTTNQNSVIATAPGSYQSEIGCPGDWQPDCLRSWLQDPDGDGSYRFSASIPAGSYEFKVALNETWDVNYGAGGVQNGANIPFTVPGPGTVTFSYDAATHVPSVSFQSSLPGPDGNVFWAGVYHDSRDPLYRTPGGAAPAGTPVKLRLRTFHDDVTAVTLRLFSLNAASQTLVAMTVGASDVDCYGPAPAGFTCDFWEATLPNGAPDNYWYRFVVTDGSDTDYYADDTSALDGGRGRMTDDPVDQSWALMVYDPAFTTPEWTQDAVIYQIFPDRFRNGDKKNDPPTDERRYDDPVIALPWNTLPEGYCRNYAGAAPCPWRFDTTPPDWSPTREAPRGRDYFGGDLKGVRQSLDYLEALGVTAIYFNPIFAAESNHRYDTADYYQVDPALGDLREFDLLVKQAAERGIRVILDGVFNHLSSDSPFFDRYHHYPTVGACESADSPYRDWFTFRLPGSGEPSPCAPSTPGGADTYYNGWFGFDSIPVINKSLAEVQEYFLTGPDSVSRYWLEQGAGGWRLDVMGDASFPAGYWETFRDVVKAASDQAVIIGELWQKDSTLLRFLRGDRADTTMNYRLRDAVLGLLSPGPFDSKGFADSGRVISPSEFAGRIESIREDYPDAVYYSLMNLLGSHDTERLLWAMTPGADNRDQRELNAANLTEGKRRLQLASLLQFTMPGAPTVYYGDEVGVTGDDDPDDRRTFPWPHTGGSRDESLRAHYTALADLRETAPALVAGDLEVLFADDAAGVVAYSRVAGDTAAVVILNRSGSSQTVEVPVEGILPNGTTLIGAYAVGTATPGPTTALGGELSVSLAALSGVVLVTSGTNDLTPPAPPTGLSVVDEGRDNVSLRWSASPGAAGYHVYRSPLSGGGFVRVDAVAVVGTTYTDNGLQPGRRYFYVVRALDGAGNESDPSNEVSALPHYQIGWANLQWPPTIAHTISVVNRTANVYGQVWIDGVTNQLGATPGLRAQLGFGPDGTNPAGNPDWTWVDSGFNIDAGNNDEFVASLLPEVVGEFDYLYRYSTTGGRDWLYADLNGAISAGGLPPNPGALTVNGSGDTTAPEVPANLRVVSGSPAGIELAWDAVAGDPSLYGYEIARSGAAGGAYLVLARVTTTNYTDPAVTEGATYFYRVRAVDQSFNRSAFSDPVEAIAAARTVSLVFNVTVPATTDGTGRSVYIAGFLDRLDGGLPQWDPGGVVLTRLDATHWTITLSGREGTQIEYKFTLGSWDFVEKGGACDEVANRQLTLTYGSTGVQTVNDVVPNWRNVAPCGN